MAAGPILRGAGGGFTCGVTGRSQTRSDPRGPLLTLGLSLTLVARRRRRFLQLR